MHAGAKEAAVGRSLKDQEGPKGPHPRGRGSCYRTQYTSLRSTSLFLLPGLRGHETSGRTGASMCRSPDELSIQTFRPAVNAYQLARKLLEQTIKLHGQDVSPHLTSGRHNIMLS
jgi:hypothetical protein